MFKIFVMITTVLFAGSLIAADLDSLSREFNAVKAEINRKRGGEREKLIQKKLVPVLKKAAALKTDEAVLFLGKIVEQEQPEFSKAACRPLASTGRPEAVDILLQAATRRPELVRKTALSALRHEKSTLSENQLLNVNRIILSRQKDDLRVEAVNLMASQQTLFAAKTLLQNFASRSVSGELARAMENALSSFKKKEILTYFFVDALAGGVKAPQQLVALLHVAAKMKSKEAKTAAIKLIEHRSSEVAGAAVTFLAALGFEGGNEQIIKLLKKCGRNLEPALDLLLNLAGSGSAASGRLLVQISREFNGPLRAAAISLLGKTKCEEALVRIIEALDEKDESVKTAALRAVQMFKDKRIIGPLIAFMGREQGRLQGEALKYLIKTTGKNMGLIVEDWQKWWDYAKTNFTFKPQKEGRTSVKAVDYYGIEIFSKRICFIIDRSSSMKSKAKDHDTNKQSTRMELAKKELVKTLRILKPGTMINIISFDASYKPMAKQLTPLSRAGRVKAIRHVQTMRTGHGTNIYDTLSVALKDRRVNTVFLLSDGQPSRGKYTNTSTIMREIKKQNLTRNVTINTIAIGDVRLDFMKGLAEQNGGTYVFVKD